MLSIQKIKVKNFMSTDPSNLIPVSTAQPELTVQANQGSSQPSGTINIYRPKPSPLPQNRPIGDNNTEAMDDMLSYLD